MYKKDVTWPVYSPGVSLPDWVKDQGSDSDGADMDLKMLHNAQNNVKV